MGALSDPVGKSANRPERLLGFVLEDEEVVPGGVAALNRDPHFEKQGGERLTHPIVQIT